MFAFSCVPTGDPTDSSSNPVGTQMALAKQNNPESHRPRERTDKDGKGMIEMEGR